jgi:hypothetical protein
MEAGKSIKAGRIFAIEMDKQLRGFGNGRSPRQPDLVEEMMAALDEALSDVSFSPVRQDSEEEWLVWNRNELIKPLRRGAARRAEYQTEWSMELREYCIEKWARTKEAGKLEKDY